MEEKRVETENRQELNLDQMERVNGGVGPDSRLITVSCGGCGKHFVITTETTEYKCTCGYKNTFSG